jgi:hypothetical protein
MFVGDNTTFGLRSRLHVLQSAESLWSDALDSES